jgi:hypothetical protein
VVYEKKKRSRATLLDTEMVNHTRVLERPMADILEVAPHSVDGAQAAKVQAPGKVPTLKSKRRPGRPTKFFMGW